METLVFSAVAAYSIMGMFTGAYHLVKINESLSDYNRTRLKDRKNEAVWAAHHHWDGLKSSWLWPLAVAESSYKSIKWVLSLDKS